MSNFINNQMRNFRKNPLDNQDQKIMLKNKLREIALCISYSWNKIIRNQKLKFIKIANIVQYS